MSKLAVQAVESAADAITKKHMQLYVVLSVAVAALQ
jgi:hypothetical protein